MTPLSMIFKRHREIYESRHLFDNTKTTSTEAINQVLAVAAGQADPFMDIKRYADYKSVNEQVAAMAIKFKHPSQETHETVVEIQKCIAILGDGYIHHNEHVIKTLQQFPDIFNEKILSLSGSDMKYYSHRACIDYVNVSRLMQGINKVIDLKYWNIAGLNTDILENCKANGITTKTVLSALLSEIPVGENPEHLKGLMEVSYLSNLFKVGNPLELLLISYEVTLKNRSNPFSHHLIPVTIVKALVEAKLMDNPEDWTASKLLGGRLKYLLWVLRFRQWYADETVVTTEDGLRIVINHHELVSHAINNLQMLPIELSYKQHPKDVLGVVLTFVVATKANELRTKIKDATKYHLPETVKARLPEHWHFVDNEYSQIMEGQVMNHCCGGRHYLHDRSQGNSIFFHVDTDEPHGLTVELKLSIPHQLKPSGTGSIMGEYSIESGNVTAAVEHYTKDLQKIIFSNELVDALYNPKENKHLFTGSENHYRVYKLGQVKGRRNRSPSKSELIEVKAGLLRISEIKGFSEYVDSFRSISFIDPENLEVVELGLTTKDDNLGEELYSAAKKGHLITLTENVDEFLENLHVKRMAETPVIVSNIPEFDITLNGIDENPMARLFREAREPMDFSLARMAADLRADHAVLQPTTAEAFLTANESEARAESVYSGALSAFRNRYDYSYFAYIKAFREHMNAPIFTHHGDISNIARGRENNGWETDYRNSNAFSNVISLKNTNYIWLPIEPEETAC